MNLKAAQIGDVYRFYIDSDGAISDHPTKRTILGAVIGFNREENSFLLGWKADEPYPTNARGRNGTKNNQIVYVHNQSDYKYGKLVSPDLRVVMKIVNGFDGCACKKCKNFYQFAEPNHDDGTLTCWSCRSF